MFGRIFIAIVSAAVALCAAPAIAQDDAERGSTPVLSMGAGDNLFPKADLGVRDSRAVQAVLAANPGREVVICLAGCKVGHASILWQRPKQAALVDGGAGLASMRSTRFDEAPGVPSVAATVGEGGTDTVICVAGCSGPVGLVVWRGMRLAWIRGDQKAHLAQALRRIGDRLVNADRLDSSIAPQRNWVGAVARAGLVAAMGDGSSVPVQRATVEAAEAKPRG